NPDGDLLLRNAVAVAFTVHAITAMLMVRALAPLIGTTWARTSGLCWLVNPMAFLLASQAIEAAVYSLVLVLLFSAHTALAASFRAGSANRPHGRYGIA